MAGKLTDPKSWGDAIKEVGAAYAIIFALIAVIGGIGYVTIKVVSDQIVPAIVMLTSAIQANTDQSKATDLSVSGILAEQSKNTQLLVSNQSEIIEQHKAMQQAIDTLVANDTVAPSARAYDANDRAQLWKRIGQLQQENGALKQKLGK